MAGYGKTAHFAHYFKIELLVFKGIVALSSRFFVMEVMRCEILDVSVQSFLAYCFKPNREKVE